MRTLLILLTLALLACGALFYAWRLAGRLPRAEGVRPVADEVATAATRPDDGSHDGPHDGPHEVPAGTPPRAVAPEPRLPPEPLYGLEPLPARGLEEGGLATAGRPRADFSERYRGFSPAARTAAAGRLADQIRAMRETFDDAARADLVARLSNAPRAEPPGESVALVLALIDEREWLVESLSLPDPEDP